MYDFRDLLETIIEGTTEEALEVKLMIREENPTNDKQKHIKPNLKQAV